VNKTCFSNTKRPGFSSPHPLFVFFLWPASLHGCKQYMKVIVRIFSTQYESEKNYRNYGEISQVLIKRDKFHVKRMSIHLGKKSNSFKHKRTFLPAVVVMNKKFIANLVGRIWGSNLSQNPVDTMTNVWWKF